MSKPRILIVDDEKQILRALSLNLARHFDVVTADDSRNAVVKLVEGEPFDVVVSDVRMPEIDGISFLRRAREIAPSTMRIMLTGFADLACAIAAVNEANVFRILRKPCSTPDLIRALDDAVQAKISSREDISEVAVEGLPDRIVNLDRSAKIGRLAGESLGGLGDVSTVLNALVERAIQLNVANSPADNPLAEMLDDLRWASRRVSDVSSVFRELQRQPSSHESIVDVVAVVERVLMRLERVGASHGVSVIVRASQSATDIRIAEAHLEQVLVNLLLNAFDATRVVDKDPRVEVELAWNGANLHLSVRDNGPGVHPHAERRLFEPYASGDDKRIGLGLAVSRQLARTMGADLVFRRPTIGQGAEFRLVFERPRVVARVQPVAEISEADELERRRVETRTAFDESADTIARPSPVQLWGTSTARLPKKE